MLNLFGFLVSGIVIVYLGLLSAKYAETINQQQLEIERLKKELSLFTGAYGPKRSATSYVIGSD